MNTYCKKLLTGVGACLIAGSLALTPALTSQNAPAFAPAAVAPAYGIDIVAPTIPYYKELMIVTDKPFKLKEKASANSADLNNGPDMTNGIVVHGEGMSSKSKDYVYIRYESQPGWVPLSKVKEVTALDTQLYTQAETVQTSSPGGGDTLTTIPEGEKVAVDADSGDGYYHVYYNAKPGWVAASSLGEKKVAPVVEQPQTPEPAEVEPAVEISEEKSVLDVLRDNPLIVIVGGLAVILVIVALVFLAVSSRRR